MATKLSFEGQHVESMRASLQALQFIPKTPLRCGDRITLMVECVVEKVVHTALPRKRDDDADEQAKVQRVHTLIAETVTEQLEESA